MAGNRSLGTLTVDLIAKVGGFKAGMDKASRDAEKAASDIDRTLRTIGKGAAWAGTALAGAFASAATSATAFAVTITTSFASASRELSNFSTISGLSVENFQRYSMAAKTVGLSNEKLADQMKDVNERIGEYIATGKGPLSDFIDEYGSRVGTTAEHLAKLNDPMAALTKIVSDMQKLGASDLEISFVLESLASDTTNLIPLLKDGASAMGEYIDQMDRVGVLSADQVAAGRAVAQELDVLQGQYALLKDQIAAELAPAVIMLIQDFQNWITEAGNAEAIAYNLGTAVDIVRVAFHSVAGVIETATAVVRVFVADAMLAINLISGLTKMAAIANPFTAQVAIVTDGPKAYLDTLKATQAEVRAQLEKDVNYRSSIESQGAMRAQAAWAKAGAAMSDSWNSASTNAKAYQEVANSVSGGANIPGAGSSSGPIGAINEGLRAGVRLTAEQIKQQSKLDEISRKQYETIEKQIKADEVRAKMVGETSRLKQLDLEIEAGLVEGSKEQLERLREAASLYDQNTAALKNQEEARRSADKAARSGESAASRAAKESEREAEKRLKEAERIRQVYDDQVLSLERSIFMIGKEGEAAAMAWETSRGKFKDYSEDQKNHLMLLSQNVDAAQKAFDVQKKAQEEKAKKLEEEANRQEDINNRYREYLDDVQHNLNLLGKSADEQERINALKELGISADSEAGKVLTETLKIYQAQRKAVEDQVAAMDELRSSFSGALSEWVSGTKSFKDAFKDALDQVHKRIIQLISDRWTESLFGSFGSNEGGKIGGSATGFFGKLFGVKDTKQLQDQIGALRGNKEDGTEVLPYDPQGIEDLRAEAKRMTDGVIAVHQEAASAMAGSVGGNANAVAESAVGNMEIATEGAIEGVKETGQYAQEKMTSAVGEAESAMDGEGVGFIGRIRGWFSKIFKNEEGEGGIFSALKGFFSKIGSWISNIFSSFSGGSVGGGGGFFSSIAGLFSGGRANGGPVSAGRLYRVNENVPEMLSIGNQDYLMMGKQNGMVSNAVGGGMQQVNNFVIHGRIDRRTESQIAQDVGQRTQRALNRNS